MTEQVPWPAPPREPGAWGGGPPVGPEGGPRGGAPSPVAVPTALDANPQAWSAVPGPPPPLPGPEPGPVGPAVYDRAPTAVIAVSILVLAVLAGAIAYLVVRGDDRYPDEWDERVQPIADWVALERGLRFEHPVEVNFLTDAEYSAASTSEPSTEEDEAAIADMAAEMRALGLLTEDIDLVNSMNTLSDSGTLAYYSPATKQVYVRGQTLTPALRVTLAHELVHVLQDQHFDLSRMSELSSTRGAVLRAVAEGDAGRIEDTYVAEVLTESERDEFEAESDGTGEEAIDSIREEVPDALTAIFAAPYVFGEPLITYLMDTEGTAAIDEALRNPPSEQVLLNPHLWETPEAEEVEVDVEVPSGATEVRRDVFGPVAWYLVLSARVEPRVALDAVDGLGGDEYVTYRDGQRFCVRMTVVGDDAESTDTFETALSGWVQAGPAETSSVIREGENLQFQACDPGTESGATGSLALEVLALPATRTALYLEMRDSGMSEAQAWCVADGVIGELTMQDLVNPNLAEERDLMGMMTPIMQTCVAGG